jgi:tetratricopeptide (TPR) repeat protein
MHRLIDEGKGDTEEAEALADQMDFPWYAMTAKEQSRMRGLAADLHSLREGGPKRVEMSPDQFAAWQQGARQALRRGHIEDPDEVLDLLRRPVPARLPGQFVPFLQARCWEKLGDLETALLFMKQAYRLDQNQALCVLLLLQQMGKVDELSPYANRVIDDPSSPPLELYLAGVALLSTTRNMRDSEARPTLLRIVPVLRKALSQYLSSQERAQTPEADAYISQALGLSVQRLGDQEDAIKVYSEAIERNPSDAQLLVSRGLALYETAPRQALADFAGAVRASASTIWPYLLLARHYLQGGVPAQALRLAVMAEWQPGPAVARAEVYEIIAMAYAELGQPLQRVRENFDRAIALDPNNRRIQDNRDIAVAFYSQARSVRSKHRRHWQEPPVKPETSRRYQSKRIDNEARTLSEERLAQVSEELVEV